VSTAYNSNPETVLEILKNVARNTPGVLEDPEPVAIFRGFGESALNFALRFFCSFSESPTVSSEVGIRVNNALSQAGIEIPFPQRSIRITSELPKSSGPSAGGQQSSVITGQSTAKKKSEDCQE
jgi:small-conductance mechanosensitive channel